MPKRPKHYLRKLARGEMCEVRIPMVCNFDPATTVLAHVNGGGAGMKSHDFHGAHCCSACHDAVDKRNMNHGHSYHQVLIWFYEGVLRTQKKLIDNGEVDL